MSLRPFSAGSVAERLCDVGRTRGKSLAEIDLGDSVYPCLLLEHEQTYRKRNAMSLNDADSRAQECPGSRFPRFQSFTKLLH